MSFRKINSHNKLEEIMKINKIFMSGLLSLACLTASAQNETEYVFNPHWYLQGQIGGQYTLGELGFGDLLSPNVQLGAGYNFNPVVGARFNMNFWQSKAGSEIYGKEYDWKWNYVAPAVDATFNLSNLFCGFNPERKWNVGVFAGLGLNIAFGNGDAADAQKAICAAVAKQNGLETYNDQTLRYLWSGTKCRLFGQVGANVDYKINDELSLGLELSANTVNDKYNSKKAGNSDWYFNALIGVKYNLGSTFTKKTRTACCKNTTPETVVTEPVVREVVKVVEKPAEVVEKKVEPIRRDVFFTISSGAISISEMQKVNEIAEYMKANPNAKVTVTGYADKGTGNVAINKRVSEKRAKAVYDALVNKYGISASRITMNSKGDSEQPYAEQILNRVTICIAE